MKGRPFSDEELMLVHDTKLTHTQVANQTGRTASTIYLKRKSLGIKVKSNYNKYIAHLDLLTDASVSTRYIAAKLNESIQSISSKRCSLGVSVRKNSSSPTQ